MTENRMAGDVSNNSGVPLEIEHLSLDASELDRTTSEIEAAPQDDGPDTNDNFHDALSTQPDQDQVDKSNTSQSPVTQLSETTDLGFAIDNPDAVSALVAAQYWPIGIEPWTELVHFARESEGRGKWCRFRWDKKYEEHYRTVDREQEILLEIENRAKDEATYVKMQEMKLKKKAKAKAKTDKKLKDVEEHISIFKISTGCE